MNETFRKRVFTPLVLPLGMAAAILVFAIALSRVLLAIPATISTMVAVLVAGYVLLVAALVAQRERISARALGTGLTLAVAGLVVAGAVAGAAGVRPVEEEHGAEGEGGGAGGGEGAGGEGAGGGEGEGTEVPPDALVWKTESSNLEYTAAPAEGPAGSVTIALDNPSGVPHNVVIEGVEGDEPIVEADGGATDVATVEIEPGTYTYFCSVPGHRQAGMEGEITLS